MDAASECELVKGSFLKAKAEDGVSEKDEPKLALLRGLLKNKGTWFETAVVADNGVFEVVVVGSIEEGENESCLKMETEWSCLFTC